MDDGPKEDLPNIQFLMCDTHSEAVKELDNVISESWEDCVDDMEEEYYLPPLSPEDVFLRPVKIESGHENFSDAEWVVIELNPDAQNEKDMLMTLHSYNNLGSIPPSVILTLCERNPYFMLAHYSHADVGYTFGAFQLAAPILKSLREIIKRFELQNREK